jgi:hypothetical protein
VRPRPRPLPHPHPAPDSLALCPPKGAGTEFVAWLADARRALVVGTENFIARDVDGFAELLDPARLLPLLGQVNVLELLGQHHGR